MPRTSYHEMDHHFPSYKFLPYAPTTSLLHRYNIEPQLISATAVHFQQLQYLRYEPLELTSACPLDLSLKGNNSTVSTEAPITPPCTPSPHHNNNNIQPSKSKPLDEETSYLNNNTPQLPSAKKFKTTSPVKRNKAVRKLNFDEDKSSPVSGTIIRELGPDETLVVRKGDIDPAFNVVEVTEEAKAELAKIDNHIGDYVCRLCRELYEDAFGLAQHRCSRIVHVEYRCPECDKVFNCPANLASHRRWHKPRPNAKNKETASANKQDVISSDHEQEQQLIDDPAAPPGEHFSCADCGKKFRRLAYLRKHQATHLPGAGPGVESTPAGD